MKSVTGALIRPDRIERVAVRSIEEMQAAVGGWVEALSLDYATAYFDGDGRMKNLPYNVVGSLLRGRDILGTCSSPDGPRPRVTTPAWTSGTSRSCSTSLVLPDRRTCNRRRGGM